MNTTPQVNQAPPDGYCLLAVRHVGSDGYSPLRCGNMLVLWDTVAIAHQFLPLLGMGRIASMSVCGEKVDFTPLAATGYNSAAILRRYDPFNVPTEFPGGIRSETKGKEWKHHIMFSHAYLDRGQMQVEADGTITNLALREQPESHEKPRARPDTTVTETEAEEAIADEQHV